MYEQMPLGSKQSYEEVDGSRTNKPANKLITLYVNDAKRMEGDAVVSMKVNNFAGVMSKADAFGRKETAAAEKEGGSFGALLVGGCGARAVSHKTPTYFRRRSQAASSVLFVRSKSGC